MNADFHYYATYLAARLADYNKDDAKKIAHAAAFVDYFDFTTARSNWIFRSDLIFTSQDLYEMGSQALRRLPIFDIPDIYWPNYVFEIWASFHFLPGNEDLSTKYTGDKEHREQFHKDGWSFDKRCEETFKLLCKSNSRLAVKMVNDVKDARKNNAIKKEALLHLIGLRMHVLADSWAHQNFSAAGQWFMNDTDKDVYEITGEEKDIKKIGWIDIKDIEELIKKFPNIDDTDEAFTNNKFFAIPAIAPFYDQIVELGHGRMGHLPDYSSMSYSYRPIWSGEYITRDGVEVFTNALAQMAEAMICIKKGKEFFPESYYNLDEKLSGEGKKEKFIQMLKTKKIDLSKEWLVIIQELFNFSENVPEFSEKQWYSDYNNKWPFDSENTDLIYFNSAAAYHKHYVVDYLRTNHLYLNASTSFEHSCYLKTASPANLYISKAKIDGGITYSDFYPQLRKNEKVLLKMVKQDSAPLKSGDIVEIKTMETTSCSWGHRISDKPYMTAFETDNCIMYATQGYRTNAQRWKVELPHKEKGTTINSGDEITIQNVFFEAKPYLNSIKKGDEELLTFTAEPRTWILETPSKEVLELLM